VLKQALSFLEAAFGSAASFKFKTTDVLLVALLLAVVVHLERLRAAVLQRRHTQ
jgi:hypothetical protein